MTHAKRYLRMALTDHLDLTGGETPWDDFATLANDPILETCEIAIIGSGISGSLIAERLSADGHGVTLIDRRPPATGSTAASTAQIMWAMDVPLSHLTQKIGEAEAAARWQRVFEAVRSLDERILEFGINCGRDDCETLYLAGDVLGEMALKAEGALRAKHGLPSRYLEPDVVAERFGIAPRAALLSQGNFTIDPVRLAHGLVEIARSRGARLCHGHDVTALTPQSDGVLLTLASGQTLRAGLVILATGYESARLFLPSAFTLGATFAIATPPGALEGPWTAPMIWEASDPYLYIRTDTEGRILAGGEDIDSDDPTVRDALIGEKAGTIAAKLSVLLGAEDIVVERAWSATFGSSPDGLPAIGRAANIDNVWLAYGYGGNGISFSTLASEIISADFRGDADPLADAFNPYRFS